MVALRTLHFYLKFPVPFLYWIWEVMGFFALQYVSRDMFATASSTGSVYLFQHTAGGHLEHKTSWKQIHSFIGSNVKFKLSQNYRM